MKSLIPGTPEHQKTVANCAALHVAYTAETLQAQQLPNLQRKEPLTYKQARAAHDAKDWIAACDLEMTKLRILVAGKCIPNPHYSTICILRALDGFSNTR